MDGCNDKKESYFLSFIAKQRAIALLALIVLMCLAFGIAMPETFGTYDNFALILLNMSSEAMVLIAISLVLIMGEIDLSLGANMVLGGIITGRLMIVAGMNMWLAMAIALVISMACGALNGFIVAKLGVAAFIATLGTSMIYLGIAILLAGTGWTDFPDATFKAMGQTKVLGLQMPVFYMAVMIVIFAILVSKTRYFRQIYYIGGNATAADLSGINIVKTKIVMYMIANMLACLGGIFAAMRFNSALPSVGAGVEMRAVTACVIGGISFTGGTGTLAGAAMGALFISTLSNLLTSIGVSPNVQYCITGIVLILAIVLDISVSKKQKA
ncbi:MAG TPA: ABC transporter permease [Feifaniaceae bacterium]|nr:ABC transporter permease [Feifaniaceae bacterium]